MSLIVVFLYLKIILLQCFQFSVSIKINCIQTYLLKKKKKNIQQICEVHILQDLHFSFRLRLVRLKLISGNQFPENRAFGCAVKFGQTENIFSLTGK